MDVKPVKLKGMVRHGATTSPEVKAEAFRLWIECGRSWRQVSRLTDISESTLHHWANSDNWQARRLEAASSFLPGASAETAFALKLAAHNASLRLQQIAFEANEYGTEPNL